MNKAITHLLALTALASSQVVMADVTVISCHGCSDSAKIKAATNAATEGEVLVFDQKRAMVSTYSVYTEWLDINPWTMVTTAGLLDTDPVLKKSYQKLSRAQEDLGEQGTIFLPDHFRYVSVAGAILDPNGSTTAIEDYLVAQGSWSQLKLAANTLVSRIAQLNLGVIDLADIVTDVVVKVQFPDGSDMTYIMEFSINPGNSELRMELVPHGNAHGPDGTALPTHPNSFRDTYFTDHNGSIVDWINYARSMGIPVTGGTGEGGGGFKTAMICEVSGANVKCRVILIRE